MRLEGLFFTLCFSALFALSWEVINIEKKVVNQREFVLCQIKVNGRVKYLYLTPLDNATTMGVIEVYENASWENALGVIADINNKIVLNGVSSNSYNQPGSTPAAPTPSAAGPTPGAATPGPGAVPPGQTIQ